MSSIAGFINKKNKDIDNEDIIKNILGSNTLSYSDSFITMGIDSSNIIYNEKENIIISFDGEIYNYKFLYEDLTIKGHKFRTREYAEVVLHGYEEYGKDILRMLRGMFSFVIYEVDNNILFGARDFYGLKPLYYYINNKSFMYSSRIKYFSLNPYFKKEFNNDMLEKYLMFKSSVGNETFFKGVYKLEAGHYFIYKDNKLKISKYYEFEYDNIKEEKEDKLYKNIRDLTYDSIISQNIDSSMGFSLGYSDEDILLIDKCNAKNIVNVSIDSKRVSLEYPIDINKLNVNVISKKINKKEYMDTFNYLQSVIDEPISNYQLVNLYYKTYMVREYSNVMVSSLGVNLFFGGYYHYLDYNRNRIYNAIPYEIRKVMGLVFSKLKPSKFSDYIINHSGKLEEDYYFDGIAFTNSEIRKVLLNSSKKNVYKDVTKKYYDKIKKYDVINKLQYMDYYMYYSNNLLSMINEVSMVNKVNFKFPYMDRMIVDYTKNIPLKYKINGKVTKYAFRNSFNNIVEVDKEYEYDKKNIVPIKEWLREKDTYDKIKSVFSNGYKLFDEEYLNKLLLEHYYSKKDNSSKIWTIYSFLLWYKENFDYK